MPYSPMGLSYVRLFPIWFSPSGYVNDIPMQFQKEADGHYQSGGHFSIDRPAPRKFETRSVWMYRRASGRGRSIAFAPVRSSTPPLSWVEQGVQPQQARHA